MTSHKYRKPRVTWKMVEAVCFDGYHVSWNYETGKRCLRDNNYGVMAENTKDALIVLGL